MDENWLGRIRPLMFSMRVKALCSTTAISSVVLFFNIVSSTLAETIDPGVVVTIPGTYPSPWNVTGILDVNGTLVVQSGGVVDVLSQVRIGPALGASAMLVVTGPGSKLIDRGNLVVNGDGSSEVRVEDGGAIQAYAGLHLFNGSVSVSGAGSRLDFDAFSSVGRTDGVGNIRIADGGTLAINSYFTLGEGGNATVTVTGTSSLLETSGFLSVGYSGPTGGAVSGNLLIADGGLVKSGSATVGNFSNINGEARIIGQSSEWIITGALEIGKSFDSTGTMRLVNGGRVNNTEASIGAGTGSVGAAVVKDSGSSWASSGTLTVGQAGSGTLTISDGGEVSANSVALATNTGSAGFINIGAGLGEDAGSAGRLSTDTLSFGSGNGTLTFNHLQSDYLFDVDMSGAAGTINIAGGTTILTGDSRGFAGQTFISDHLVVDGSLGGSVKVSSGGKLEGTGAVGNAIIGTGSTLIGRQGEVLNLASLSLESESNVNVALGLPGGDALFNIAGDLTLDGSLNISDLGGFGAGIYRLMKYGGALTDNGLDIGNVPTGISVNDLSIQTAMSTQVNLVNTTGVSLNFWDGAGPAHNGIIEGGSGTWNASERNWTTDDGALNGIWNTGFAVFQGAAGTVTVDNGDGAIAVEGMQFATDGYTIKGDALILAEKETIIRVGDGSSASNLTATIDAELTGAGGLVKADFGTLVLNGANSYSGGTFVRGGTLQIAADASLGAVGGDLTLHDGVLAITGDISTPRTIILEGEAGGFDTLAGTSLTLDGMVSGNGSLLKKGAGTLVLNGANSYEGKTFVEDGNLIGNSDSIRGHIVNDAITTFDQAVDGSFAGNVAGNGIMIKEGIGNLTLTGKNSLDWHVDVGRLISGGERFEGSIAIAESAVMQFDQVVDADYYGVISGTGTLEKTGNSRLVLSADSGGFSGHANVIDGALRVDGALGGTLDILSGGRLEGIGTVGNTSNAGIVAPGHSIGTLTVDGNYTGNGGILEIETVLGDDASATDRLVVTGDVSGQTNVHVLNRDGLGAQTTNGIEIIRIGGASPDDTFTLVSDYTTEDGQAAVIGGAYAYTLHHNGIADPTDGNWYLRSTLQRADDEDTGEGDGNGGGEDLPGRPDGSRYAPSVPVYEAYPQVLQLLNAVPTLQQRVGNRYWKEAPTPAEPVFCDPAQNFRCAPTADQNAVYADGNYTVDQNGIWGRIEGAHSRFRPDVTTSSTSYDVDLYRMQAGIDGLFHDSDAGRLIGGFNVQYAHAKADISSFFGDGEISTDGYGIGGTLTWYGNNGFYVDGQAQAIWYNSDLTSLANTITRPGLANSNNGFGYALSLESGKRIEFGNGWSVTPQAQLVYSSVDFDSFSDGYGTPVSLDRGNSLQGRLGVSLDKQASWTDDNGQITRSHLYGIANLYNEFLDGNSVNVDGVSFDSRNARLWGGLGLGGSYNWANDKYSVYGEGSVNTSLTSFADSYTVKGTIGFKVKF